MPGGDRSGPNGMGPMTGRGAGFCAGNSIAGFADANPSRGGAGFGRGFGRGMGYGFRGGRKARWGAPAYVAPAPYYTAPYEATAVQQQETEVLRAQVESLQNALAEIQQHLAELKSEQTQK